MQKIRVLTTAALALVTFLTGGGVMKGTLIADLYMDTLDECRNFGSRTMNVYILG